MVVARRHFATFAAGGRGRRIALSSAEATQLAALIDGLQRTGAAATGASLMHTLATTRNPFELGGLPLSLQRRGAQFRSLSAIGRDGQLLF